MCRRWTAKAGSMPAEGSDPMNFPMCPASVKAIMLYSYEGFEYMVYYIRINPQQRNLITGSLVLNMIIRMIISAVTKPFNILDRLNKKHVYDDRIMRRAGKSDLFSRRKNPCKRAIRWRSSLPAWTEDLLQVKISPKCLLI